MTKTGGEQSGNAGEQSGKPLHAGYVDADWWNTSLWRQLEASTPRVSCNPAKCANPPECNIPNCILVDFHAWNRDHTNGMKSLHCDTYAKQTGVTSNDCVPSSMRKPWPSSSELTETEDA